MPALTPPTTTGPDEIVAMPVLALLHVPPPVGSLSDMVLPVHTDDGPVIDAGEVTTLTDVVAAQPEDKV